MSNISSSNSQGVRVPKLRFPGFEGEWEEKSLSDVATGFDYGMNAAAGAFDGLNKYIRITDIDEKSRCYIDENPVSPKGELDDKYLVLENDILFARTGASTGKTYLYKKSDGKLYFAGFLIRISVNCDNNSTFVYNATLTDRYNRWVRLTSMRSGQPGINSQEYSSYKTYYPLLPEQNKIASFLKKLDQRIEKQHQLVELLKSYKRGVANRIFRDMYDSSWRTICLGDICSITMGQSPDSSSYNTDGIGLPLVQGNADITNGITTPLRYTSNPTKVCESGSIILSVRAPVGTVSRANQRVCLGRGVCAITSSNTDFIYQLLLCYQDSWKRIEQGGTFTAISGDDISSFSVSVPDCELQNRIAVFLSQFDTKIRDEDIILQSLQKQKLALLQQLFI